MKQYQHKHLFILCFLFFLPLSIAMAQTTAPRFAAVPPPASGRSATPTKALPAATLLAGLTDRLAEEQGRRKTFYDRQAEALTALEALRAYLLRFAMLQLRNSESAEDVVQETYVRATANLSEAIALTASYSHFATEVGGTKLGQEFNAQLSRKLGKSVTGLVKFADFRRDSLSLPNVQKIWAQVEFAY